MKPVVDIFWFRRDLRLEDNAGLYHTLKGLHPVLPLFIFDRVILDDLENKMDRRVEFIYPRSKPCSFNYVTLGRLCLSVMAYRKALTQK